MHDDGVVHRSGREGNGLPQQRRRSAPDFEQALKRQELAAARALSQALPEGKAPTPRDLAQARRVLDRSLADLRRLRRDLDFEIQSLRGPAGTPRGQADRARTAAKLIPFDAAGDAIDEVIARWERRSHQLAAASERGARRARRPA
jgi:hypothetical protein